MVTITPKKAESMDWIAKLRAMRGGKCLSLLLFTVGIITFMGLVTLFTLPSMHDHTIAGGHPHERVDVSSRVNKGRRDQMLRNIRGKDEAITTGTDTGISTGTRTILDPLASKISILDKQRAHAKASRFEHDPATSRHGSSSDAAAASFSSSLPLVDNPGINPNHDKDKDKNRDPSNTDIEDVAVDNSHYHEHRDANTDTGSESDRDAQAKGEEVVKAGTDDAMYHNKHGHVHVEEDHPHTVSARVPASTKIKDENVVIDNDNDNNKQNSEAKAEKVIFMQVPYSSSQLSHSNGNSNLNAFPLLRLAYAASASHISFYRGDSYNGDDDGAAEANIHSKQEQEQEQPADGVEIFHKALRTGAICIDRYIPYSLQGGLDPLAIPSYSSSSTSSSSTTAGTGTNTKVSSYISTKLEMNVFHCLLDMFSNIYPTPTAFIEITSTYTPLLESLSPLLAAAFPQLTIVLIPVDVHSSDSNSDSGHNMGTRTRVNIKKHRQGQEHGSSSFPHETTKQEVVVKTSVGDDDTDDKGTDSESFVELVQGSSTSSSGSSNNRFESLLQKGTGTGTWTPGGGGRGGGEEDNGDTSGRKDRGSGVLCVPQTSHSNLYMTASIQGIGIGTDTDTGTTDARSDTDGLVGLGVGLKNEYGVGRMGRVDAGVGRILAGTYNCIQLIDR